MTGAHVVAEVEEGAAEGADSGHGHAVHGRGHSRVRARRSAGCVRRSCRPGSRRRLRTSSLVLFGAGQVGGAADQPGNILGEAFSTLPELSRVAMPFASAGNVGRFLSHPVGQFAVLHAIESARPDRETSSDSRRTASPTSACRSPPRLPMPFLKLSQHAIRDQELCVFRPAVESSSPA